MSKKYWKQFYKNKHILQPSSFAIFCLNFIPKSSKIVELGCGNGRDAFFFANKGYKITGVDFATQPKQKENINFIKYDIIKYLNNTVNIFDIIYTRFFLHSINDNKIDKLLKWSKKLFLAEFRTKGDIPILYKNHYRNKIDGNAFLTKMIKNNFTIIYYSKSRNVAKFKEENPEIIRIIARK